ncbi:MAG: AMP-binding protein [Ottowia sp.]|uniref:AMP-binding protein n=1 Tax=Ottowia sp. TaxID=1898956 RepID=UPI003C7845A5
MNSIVTLTPEEVTRAPYRPLNAPEPAVDVQHRADGSMVLTCPYALGPVANDAVAWLRQWADTDPHRVMLAERDMASGDWRRVSYGKARSQADAIGQALLDMGLRCGDSLAILSANSLEHAVMALGAMTVGVIAVPIAPAYSLIGKTLAKLAHVADVAMPKAVFAQNGERFAPALKLMHERNAQLIVAEGELALAHRRFETLTATVATSEVDAAYAQVGPDTIAKILFTSGSTGQPKGVVNTHRMMCVNQAMTAALRTGVSDQPPVTLSWLPWNHTMGGNALFNRNMRLGGTLYLDDGRPLPGEFQRTIRNLREVLPSTFSNVPAAFAMLADELEADPAFNRAFFGNLEALSYAAAALPDELWHRIQRLAVQGSGMRVPFTSGYGSTETAPMITTLYWIAEGASLIGLPAPGVEVKLAPVADGRYELRARGPNVTPGYYGQPELTAQAFDEEGFFCMGDAARFVNASDPSQGLFFAGRVKEDFKLLTGTWVATGPLRAAVLDALAPLVQDLVITGHDKPWLGALIWPSLQACRRLMGEPQASLAQAAASPAVRAAMAAGLARHNRTYSGSSTRMLRALLLTEPPSTEDGEINEKAYVNQSAVLSRRQDLVAQLYAEPLADGVLLPSPD